MLGTVSSKNTWVTTLKVMPRSHPVTSGGSFERWHSCRGQFSSDTIAAGLPWQSFLQRVTHRHSTVIKACQGHRTTFTYCGSSGHWRCCKGPSCADTTTVNLLWRSTLLVGNKSHNMLILQLTAECSCTWPNFKRPAFYSRYRMAPFM